MMRRIDISAARRRRRRRARWARVLGVLAVLAVVVGGGAVAVSLASRGSAAPDPAAATLDPVAPEPAAATPDPVAPTPSSTPAPPPTPTAAPLTPAEQLLAGATDPNACVVSFAGEGIVDQPELETQGALYQHLPIPEHDGLVFGGWYATPDDATAFSVPQRINGADAVACTAQQITVYGAWKSPQEVAALNVGVPILMYHQFTTRPEGEDTWLKANYSYIGDFESHMKYLADKQVYLPTWDELSAFIDGKLYIPKICAIVTDDDADPTWTELAAPIVAEYKILATSFVITTAYPGPPPNTYVIQRSHTHDMHSAGANGKGRIVNWSVAQIVADMNTSAQILGGVTQVMAYPYGHYNDAAEEGLREAGFEMARTTEPGYVRAGADKLALPCKRINYGMGLNAFIAIVG